MKQFNEHNGDDEEYETELEESKQKEILKKRIGTIEKYFFQFEH